MTWCDSVNGNVSKYCVRSWPNWPLTSQCLLLVTMLLGRSLLLQCRLPVLLTNFARWSKTQLPGADHEKYDHQCRTKFSLYDAPGPSICPPRDIRNITFKWTTSPHTSHHLAWWCTSRRAVSQCRFSAAWIDSEHKQRPKHSSRHFRRIGNRIDFDEG